MEYLGKKVRENQLDAPSATAVVAAFARKALQ
jgi:hypothetical protein